ncbi:MAG: NMD3-related protein [Candidatus Aenigmatarchaeota archaeon]
MFCIVCGKNAVVGNFCEDCFLKRERLFDVDDFSISTCDCGSYYYKGWQKSNKGLYDLLADLIEKRVKTKNKIIKKNVSFKHVGNKIFAKIVCNGMIKPCKKTKEEERDIVIILNKQKCDDCVKLLGRYSEAILQIRGDKKERILNILNLPKYATVEKTKNGYDVVFVKRSDSKNAINQLVDFDITKSFKFIGVKRGRRIIKDYYAVR